MNYPQLIQYFVRPPRLSNFGRRQQPDVVLMGQGDGERVLRLVDLREISRGLKNVANRNSYQGKFVQ